MLSAVIVGLDEIDNAIIKSFKFYKTIIQIRFIIRIYILLLSVRIYLDVNTFITVFFFNFLTKQKTKTFIYHYS